MFSKSCPNCGGRMNRQSKKCRSCYISNISRPDNWITVWCLECSEQFVIHVSQRKINQGIYCSRSCARKGSPTRKNEQVKIQCANCSVTFSKRPSELYKGTTDNNFCSLDCWYEYNQRDNHPLWAGGQNERTNPQYRVWRNKVIERDAKHCRLCHTTETLQSHHIKRFALYPDIRWEVWNGITLCSSCHLDFRGREHEYESDLIRIAATPVEVWYV